MVQLLQVFQDLERDSGRLMPLMLFAGGAVVTIVGLIIWLGGSALRRLSLLIIGSLVGFVFALTVVEVNLMPALLIGLILGGLGALVDKPAIGILTAVLVLAIVFCFLSRPFIEAPRPDGSVVTQSSKMDWRQSWVLLQSHAVGLDAAAAQVFWQMPKLYWGILGAAAVAGGVLAMTFRRTVMALCFGASGTVFIFAGMVLLLLQRSIAAVSGILAKPPFYAAVFGGMSVFGMCVQLIFFRQKKGVTVQDKESEEGSDESSSVKKSWRTS